MTTYNPKVHPKKLAALMLDGALDIDICVEFGISKTTFYRWKEDHIEFREAHEVGLPAVEKKLITDPLKQMAAERTDKGIRPIQLLADNKFNYSQNKIPTNQTNIQINHHNNVLNMLEKSSPQELIEFIQDGLIEAKVLDIKTINKDDNNEPTEQE